MRLGRERVRIRAGERRGLPQGDLTPRSDSRRESGRPCRGVAEPGGSPRGSPARPRTRSVPDLQRWRNRIAIEEAAEVEHLVAHRGERLGGAWLGCAGGTVAEAALRALDRVALGVEQAADLEQRLDVLPPVE